MYGKFNHAVDAKGRLFIPATLREELGKKFYVTISWECCLTVYSMERWSAAMDKLRAMTQVEQMELRAIFTNASEVEPDAQGRIQLKKELRNHAGLGKDVTIVGTGVYVQIWDRDTYEGIEKVENSSENLKRVIERLGF